MTYFNRTAPASFRSRRRLVPVASLALVLSLVPRSLVPSVPELSTAPDPVDVAQGELLSRWLAGVAPAARSGQLSLFVEPAAPLGAVGRGFDLFRGVDEPPHQSLRGVPYAEAISKAAGRYRLDGFLLAAMVEAESSFDAKVVSPCGALGLMQIMPDMARSYTAGDPLDPAVNLDVGARYFSELLQQFGGNVELALAAYNAGPGTVQRYGKVPPYRETTRYVRRVLEIYGDRHRATAATKMPLAVGTTPPAGASTAR